LIYNLIGLNECEYDESSFKELHSACRARAYLSAELDVPYK